MLSPDLYITKLVQDFERGPNANSGTEVARRTFHVRQGQALFQYHNPEGKIALSVRTFHHSTRGGGLVDKGSNISLAPPLSSSAYFGDRESQTAENEVVRKLQGVAIAEFKDSYKFFHNDVVEARRLMEASVKKQQSVFEIALNAVTQTGSSASSSSSSSSVKKKSVGDGGESSEFDYLSPYLRQVNDVTHMSREEAIRIRQNCLDGYKARLVEREKIIQARLSEEKTKLARKQEQYPRTLRDRAVASGGNIPETSGTTASGGARGATQADEEYEKQCAETIFRIHVLEQRLQAHGELAVKKFAALEEKLRGDERLRHAMV